MGSGGQGVGILYKDRNLSNNRNSVIKWLGFLYISGTTAPLYLSLMKSWISLDCNTSIKALIFSSSLCPF